MMIMPMFLLPENMKWVDEITKYDSNGNYNTTYKAKRNAPEEIKKSIRDYKRAYYNHQRYEINYNILKED